MDIKILDSHLREHLATDAKPRDIAKAVSLSSASIERVEPFGKGDFVYSIEVTTNRPDMASVRGMAREAATVLPQFGHMARLLPLRLPPVKKETSEKLPLTIDFEKGLVRRVCGVILEVQQHESPQYVKDRLEAAGIRSLNNIVDVTNYVMLEIGHPAHAFDYDRLKNHTLHIRESKKGESIVTLDKKIHTLPGGDIVADNGEGEIVDLLGIMGTENSVVTSNTKRILFFFDNNDPWRIRKTSMGLSIRTDAAALNEKGVDPELAMEALLRGVALYKEIADAKVVSDVVDMYVDQPKPTTIHVELSHICSLIGVDISKKQAVTILTSLGFEVEEKNSSLMVKVPSWRELDVTMAEDVIEEIARMYGYHNIPTALPPFAHATAYNQSTNQFFWETRAKEALKYFGLTEVYTYSMVSETLFEGPIAEAVTLSNPLDSEHVYMRHTLTPSLLEVVRENKARETVEIFEIANVYRKDSKEKLPREIRTLAFVLKGKRGDFFHAKGLVEQVLSDFGIQQVRFADSNLGGIGASVYTNTTLLGNIEVMDKDIVTAELNFDVLTSLATLKKTFTPLFKYPEVTEDIAFVLPADVKTGDVIETIYAVDTLIVGVTLLDIFEQNRTFHIVYQDKNKNLTTDEVADIRKKVIATVEKKFKAKAR